MKDLMINPNALPHIVKAETDDGHVYLFALPKDMSLLLRKPIHGDKTITEALAG